MTIIASVAGAAIIFVHSAGFESFLFSAVGDKTNRHIESDQNLTFTWKWPISFVNGQHIKVSNFSSGTDPTMLSVDAMHVSIDWRYLLRGSLYFPEIILDHPTLLLEKDKDGNANWELTHNATGSVTTEALKPDDRSDFPGIGKLTVKNGKIRYLDPQKETDISMEADTVTGEADEQQIQLKGHGTYQKHNFVLNLQGGNVFQLKDSDKPYPVLLHLTAGSTKADIAGTVLDPITLKGVDLKMDISGQNAADLFTLIGMALPPTPPYHLTGQLLYKNNVWHFHDFVGRMGDSDMRGFVTWDTTKERPFMRGNFVSKNLDFDDLGGFIGATPSVKPNETYSAEQKQKAVQEKSDPFLLPDTPLDISRISAMDARVTFKGERLLSQSLPLDDFFMRVELNNKVLQLKPVRFGTANGDIKSYLTVNAQQKPVKISGDFHFRKLMLKPIFEKLADKFGVRNVSDGYIGGGAKLEGTGKSLRQMLSTSDGDIGLGMEGGQISNLVIELLGLDVAQFLGVYLEGDKPVPIRCMVGDFGVTHGVMQVRHFVLDTTDTNVTGTGHINLKDETLAMKLTAHPKDSSILSLNSPLTLTGTLKHPDINLPLEKIAVRGGAATALGVLFPPAAMVAFIEPGLGEDSNCVKLIQDTKRNVGGPRQQDVAPKNRKG